MSGKQSFDSVYCADDFVAHLRLGGWDPGTLPDAVIFTYAGFDLLCATLPDEYTMHPMLGPGPGRFFSANTTDGRVGICCMGIGAPAVCAQLELLVALGVRDFLSLGTAGGLAVEHVPGDVVVLTGAVRDEGTSYHYVEGGIVVGPDPDLTTALTDALTRSGLTVQSGSTWTTDAPYRQSRQEISELRQRGVLTVEMEAAALFAVAHVRGVALASAVVVDSVFGPPIDHPTMDTATAFGKLYEVLQIGINLLAAAH